MMKPALAAQTQKELRRGRDIPGPELPNTKTGDLLKLRQKVSYAPLININGV
jgi:hypothetical protein